MAEKGRQVGGKIGNIILFAAYKTGPGTYGGINLHSAITGTNERRLVIPSNREQDKILILTNKWKAFPDSYPGRNGSFYLHGAPGKDIGKQVILEHDGVKHIFHNLSGEHNSRDVLYVLNHGFEGKEPLIGSVDLGKEVHYFFTVEGEKYVFALDLPKSRDRTGATLMENFGPNLDKLIDTSINLKKLHGFWWHPERKLFGLNEPNFGLFVRFFIEYGRHFLYMDDKPWDLRGLVTYSPVAFKVAGMTCIHCESTLGKGIGAVPGVRYVQASRKSGTVEVQGDFNPGAVKAAIIKGGYSLLEAA